MSRPLSIIVVVLGLLAAACGGAESSSRSSETPSSSAATKGYSASIASYEHVVDRPQRLLVGLTGPEGQLVSFGRVAMRLGFMGTRQAPIDPPEPGPTVEAAFLPIPGQTVTGTEPGPRLVKPSEGVGVYAAQDVRFDRPGFWEVTIEAELAGAPVTVSAPFEVLAESQLPAVGDPAPRTENRVWGASDVPPSAIDSRGEPGKPDPAPELHSTVIAQAIAAQRPLMVVISTPVYCQSRFCGPITDSVQALAKTYGDRMAFVHLEVFKDFEGGVVNKAAAEWIKPRQGEMREPWTYVVGRDGRITERLDNVASDAELKAAVEKVLAGSGH